MNYPLDVLIFSEQFDEKPKNNPALAGLRNINKL